MPLPEPKDPSNDEVHFDWSHVGRKVSVSRVGVDVWLSELCFVCVGINTYLAGEQRYGGRAKDMAGEQKIQIWRELPLQIQPAARRCALRKHSKLSTRMPPQRPSDTETTTRQWSSSLNLSTLYCSLNPLMGLLAVGEDGLVN